MKLTALVAKCSTVQSIPSRRASEDYGRKVLVENMAYIEMENVVDQSVRIEPASHPVWASSVGALIGCRVSSQHVGHIND